MSHSNTFTRHRTRFRLPLALAMLAAASIATFAEESPLPSKSALDAAIHDYIMAHPEVIRESLARAEQADQVANTKKVLRDEKNAIYKNGSPTIGPDDAKVSIVEFLDYNCPYCRKTTTLVTDYLKKHPDTRLIVKDIANFGKNSEAASRIVLAAASQGKFAEMHDALMARNGQIDEAVALATAEKLGLDMARLKTDAASKDVDHKLMQTRDLANVLNVGGTPLFIIGHQGIAGAPDDLAAQIEKLADDVRKNGCDVC